MQVFTAARSGVGSLRHVNWGVGRWEWLGRLQGPGMSVEGLGRPGGIGKSRGLTGL